MIINFIIRLTKVVVFISLLPFYILAIFGVVLLSSVGFIAWLLIGNNVVVDNISLPVDSIYDFMDICFDWLDKFGND